MTTELLLDGSQFLGSGVSTNQPMPIIPAANQNIIAADDQHQNNEQVVLSRRQRARRGALAKIDSVYASVHALEIIANLLNDAHSYLETISRDFEKKKKKKKKADDDESTDSSSSSLFQIPCDCLQVAIDGIGHHGSIVSQAIANTSDTKEVKYAQTKLVKRQKENYHSQLRHRGVMARNPQTVLTASLNYARENLDGILLKTNPDFLIKKANAKKRKKSPEADADGKDEMATAMETEGESEENRNIIDLPRPMEEPQYSPIETVAYITNIIEHQPGREYLRAYKDKIMEEKLVPIKKTQLNFLVKQYGGTGKPVAPLNWKERGVREMGWDRLLTLFQAKQDAGGSWSIADTRNVLEAAATDGRKQPPPADAINNHHSTLILLHKRRNHINEQILIQERRLRERPPTKPTTKKKKDARDGPKAHLNWIRFDKDDPKYAPIDLPPPSEGELMYSPAETVTHVMNYIQSEPRPDRTRIRLFKEKMMAEKVIPISISQLNTLIKAHGGPDKEPAPKCWNSKGREELISIEELTKMVIDSQLAWNIENTCEAVWVRKKQKMSREGVDIRPPDRKTVNAYHTALLSIPEIAHKVVKPEIVRIKPGPKPKNFQGV